MTHRIVNERGLVGDFFCADSKTPRPTVLLLGGSEGGKSWSDTPEAVGLLAPLVGQGSNALSLAYFGTEGLPASLEMIPLEYFEGAFGWLAEQPEVIPDRYALVGGSKGGELALVLGSRFPQVKAVAAFVPASVVFPGLGSDLDEIKSSWSHRGEGLPFVPYSASAVDALMEDVQTGQFLETYTRMLQDEPAAAQAAIPVEDTQGALLLISGTRDAMWPSTLMCERMTARLSEAGFRFPYEHVALGAGHNVVEHGDFWPTVTGFLGREAGGRGTSG